MVRQHNFIHGDCADSQQRIPAYAITSTLAWWTYAIAAPMDLSLMTGPAASAGGRPCNNPCTNSLVIGFYKKNRICRGYLCCARRRACLSCNTATAPCTASPARNTVGRCH